MRKTINKPGFTLVELLVVMSIISLLMATLLPALGSARFSGMMAKCLANTRALGQATINYASDFRDLYPLSTTNNGSIGFVFAPLSNYLNCKDNLGSLADYQAYLCPAETAPINGGYNAYRQSMQGPWINSTVPGSLYGHSAALLSGFRQQDVGIVRNPSMWKSYWANGSPNPPNPQLWYFPPDRSALWYDGLWNTNQTGFGSGDPSWEKRVSGPSHIKGNLTANGVNALYNVATADGSARARTSNFPLNSDPCDSGNKIFR